MGPEKQVPEEGPAVPAPASPGPHPQAPRSRMTTHLTSRGDPPLGRKVKAAILQGLWPQPPQPSTLPTHPAPCPGRLPCGTVASGGGCSFNCFPPSLPSLSLPLRRLAPAAPRCAWGGLR